MFINIESTPNPLNLKFIFDEPVVGAGIFEFNKDMDTTTTPFVSLLFSIDGVVSLFFNSDFITVTKEHHVDWEEITPLILNTIKDYAAQNGLPLIKGSPSSLENTDASHDPVIRQIVAILEKQVRPVLANDGGDVSFESFNNGVVYVRLMGACSGCPGAAATLKSGIENMLRYYVPEVLEVRSLNT